MSEESISQKSRRAGGRRKESWRKVDAPNELNLFGTAVPAGWMGNRDRGQPSLKITLINGDGPVNYDIMP